MDDLSGAAGFGSRPSQTSGSAEFATDSEGRQRERAGHFRLGRVWNDRLSCRHFPGNWWCPARDHTRLNALIRERLQRPEGLSRVAHCVK